MDTKKTTKPQHSPPCPQQVCWNWKCVLNEAASVTAGVAETFLHTHTATAEIPCWSLNMIPPRNQPWDPARGPARGPARDPARARHLYVCGWWWWCRLAGSRPGQTLVTHFHCFRGSSWLQRGSASVHCIHRTLVIRTHRAQTACTLHWSLVWRWRPVATRPPHLVAALLPDS